MSQQIRKFKMDLAREYGSGQRMKKFSAVIVNPSIRACLLIRLATIDSKVMYTLARNLLITLHSIDVGPGLRVGASLAMPHPVGIVLGRGVTLGDDVVLYQGVTLGAKSGGYPSVGNGVTIYPGAIVVGAITVGRGAVIGAGKFLDKDVPPGGVVR